MIYVYVYEDVDGCVWCEAFDGGGGGELGISGISEMVESSSKRLCSATGEPLRRISDTYRLI